MTVCPNKKSKQWLEISNALGEDWAMLSFIRNGNIMPESIERAKELITDKGIFESLFSRSLISVEAIEDMLVKSGAVYPNPSNGLYTIKENSDFVKAQFSKITDEYGFVLQYNDDLVYVNKDAVLEWNKIEASNRMTALSLTELSQMFLNRLGVVTVESSNDIIERYGSYGIADVANRMIKIQSGMEDVALPEEALHFFIEMMPQDNEALLDALDKIRLRSIYKQTLDQYKNNPNYQINGKINFSKIRKEALAKELVSLMQSKKKDRSVFYNLLQEILNWIKGVKLKVDSFEKLQQMFLSDNIEFLNRNVKSNEIYNQLTDKEKAYYEGQIQTEEQKTTLSNILTLSYKTQYKDEDHSYTSSVTGAAMPSVTQVLGSDFYSELDQPDVILDILDKLYEYKTSNSIPISDEELSKDIINNIIKELMAKNITEKELIKTAGVKLTSQILKALEARRKTLFGTAIHSIVEAVVFGKNIDIDQLIEKNPDLNIMITRPMLQKLIYGDINQLGILQILQKEKENGSVLLSEIVVNNEKLGGTLDLVAIRKDGTVEVFDFKTKFLRKHSQAKKTFEEEYITQVNILSSQGIKDELNTIPALIGRRRSLMQKHTQQLSLYKSILMESGIRVGNIKVIGIPYTLSDNGKVDNIKVIMSDSLKYDKEIGSDIFFNEILPSMNAVDGPKVLREDPRIKEIESIDKIKLKDAFGVMMARITQVYDSFIRNKNSKITQSLVDESSSVDSVGEQLAKVRETLEGYDEFTNFLQTQLNFIDVIDSSDKIIIRIAKEFDSLRKTTALNNDPKAQSEKLNELMKMKDFLIGYQKMFEEMLKYFDNLADSTDRYNIENNMIVSKLNQMVGVINNVRNLYVDTITPHVVDLLKDTFDEEQINNLKREYSELISAAKVRGDLKRVKELEKELKELIPSAENIKSVLKGNRGDAGILSYFIATISNPDMIIAGVAKRLKATLDKVRLINKKFRDELSKELQKRNSVFGVGLSMKERNQSLVYDTEVFDEYTGETSIVRVLKSEFDEKLYFDYSKLKYALNTELTNKEGVDEEKVKAARQALNDFKRKYLTGEYTEAYEKIYAILDVPVVYNGKTTTVRQIREEAYDKINKVRARYHRSDIESGNVTSDDIKELQLHYSNLSSLSLKMDINGNPKTGSDLIIAETLNKFEEASKGMREEVEYKGAFDRESEKVKLIYGEDSDDYKEWLSKNSRIKITEEYYTRRKEIIEEMERILPNPDRERIDNIYKEISTLQKPFRDKDGVILAQYIPENIVNRIKSLQEELIDLRDESKSYNKNGLTLEEQSELNKLYYLKKNAQEYDRYRIEELKELGLSRKDEQNNKNYSRLLSSLQPGESPEELMEKYNELKAELATMSTYEETSYYKDELKQRRIDFARTKGVQLKELASSSELTKEFMETEWFKKNHIITVKEVVDNFSDNTSQVFSYKPISIWFRSKPVEKYIERIPGRHFYQSKVKESFINSKGETVELINKNTKDVLGRPLPKSNEAYKAQFGVDHPYLNKEYTTLKNKVNNNTASEREKVDYENLIYLKQTMLDAQEKIEFNQRLGLAVPFMEKTLTDRTIESEGKNIISGASSVIEGIKRKFKRDETDIDEGLAPESEIRQLATVDNERVRFIPVRYKSKGEISNASYDVWGGVLNYVGSINRKIELEKELAMVNGLEEILGDKENQPKTEAQNLVFNQIFKKYNLPELEKKLNMGSNRRLDIIKSFINSTMYNEEMFAGIDILGINSQKAISTLMGISSFAILAGAPLNWTVNMLSGNVQNMIEAAGGNVFDFEDFTKAKGIIYGNGVFGDKYGSVMKDMMSDYDKVGNMSFWGQIMEIFDPIQGEFENEYGVKTRFNTVKNILKTGAFAGKIWGEWEIQMTGFIAFMRGHKLYNGKVYDRESFLTMKLGTDISNMTPDEIRNIKLEALNEFNKLDITLLDLFEMNDKKELVVKKQYEDIFQLGSKQFTDIIAKLHSMQKRINGSYSKFDRTYAEKTSIGRMMFFFRKYVIPLALNRWGERRVNYEGMQIEQGFYLTFLQTVGKDLIKFRFNVIKNWNTYSDNERRAIKRTLADFGALIAIIAMYSLLLGFDDDDKDRFKKLREKNWGAQAMIYVLLKTRSETEQFLPLPGAGLNEINRIYSNPSLIFNEITRYIDMSGYLLMHTGSMVGLSSDDGLYYKSKVDDSGLKDEGDSKLLAKIISSMGYTGKTFHPVDAIKSYEYTQRIK